MKRLLAVLLVLILALFLVGCAVPIKDIKENPDNYVGKTISVKGLSSSSIKLGKLSGFMLTEGNSSIAVSSETLPRDSSKVTVKGVVMKDTLFGTYILAKNVR